MFKGEGITYPVCLNLILDQLLWTILLVLNLENEDGETALFLAVKNCNKKNIAILQKAGAKMYGTEKLTQRHFNKGKTQTYMSWWEGPGGVYTPSKFFGLLMTPYPKYCILFSKLWHPLKNSENWLIHWYTPSNIWTLAHVWMSGKDPSIF